MWNWFVDQVWPNLVASLLWAPLALGASHVALRRHITNTVAKQQDPEPAKQEAAAS